MDQFHVSSANPRSAVNTPIFPKLAECDLKFWQIGLLIIVLIWAAMVRLWGLESLYFIGDDALHIIFGAKTTVFSLGDQLRREAHPPLLYLILNTIMHWGGGEYPLILRSASLVPGLLTVALAFHVGLRQWKNYYAALLLATIVGISPVFISTSQSIRQYMIAMVFTLIALISVYRQPKMAVKTYLLSSFLAFFSHYGALITLAGTGALGLFRVLTEVEKRSNLHKGIFVVCWSTYHIGLCAASLYLASINGFKVSESYMAKFSWTTFEQLFTNTLTFGGDFFFVNPSPLLAKIILGLVLVGYYFLFKNRKFKILVFCIVPLLGNIVLAYFNYYPFIGYRYSMFVIFSFYFPIIEVCAFATNKSPHRYIPALIVVVLLIVGNLPNRLRMPTPTDYFKNSLSFSPANRDEFSKLFSELTRLQKQGSRIVLPINLTNSFRMEAILKVKWATIPKDLQISAKESCLFSITYHTLNSKQLCHCKRKLQARGTSGPITVPVQRLPLNNYNRVPTKHQTACATYEIISDFENFQIATIQFN